MGDQRNNDFADFRLACEDAPERTFEFAKTVREMIGDVSDQFIKDTHALGLVPDNSDGIHDIEARLFDMLRPQNAELEAAVGLGAALREAPHDPLALHGSKQDILGRLRRERAFLDSRDGTPPAPESGSFRRDETLLLLGDGEMWMVRVVNDGDDLDYVDLEVRAPTLEAAADKAEAHARKHADFYFEQREPVFIAERQNIHRIDDEGEEIDDGEDQFAGSDLPFPGQEG